MAVYEFQDEDTLRRFVDSPHMKELRADYERHFASSERARFGYVQVWP